MANMLPMNERKAIMQEPCQGCYYFSGWNCDYIILEKHRRPCPPGDECTVRKKRGASGEESLVVSRRKANQLPPKPVGIRDRKPYTVQVKHPRPVMNAEPVKQTNFNQTKPPKPKKKPKAPGAPARKNFAQICGILNTPEFVGMYENRCSDYEIAKVAGCSPNSVLRWRRETGRPVIARMGPKTVRVHLESHLDEIRADLAQGKSDYALSKKIRGQPEVLWPIPKGKQPWPSQGKARGKSWHRTNLHAYSVFW